MDSPPVLPHLVHLSFQSHRAEGLQEGQAVPVPAGAHAYLLHKKQTVRVAAS
jgi:hypothetical protein